MRRPIKIALAGQPNVGKSVVFHQLTGVGVMISNYPGTTVDVNRGHTSFRGQHIDIVDLPGTYSLEAVSVDQEVAIRVLIEEKPDAVIVIADATNLERNLYFVLQILELGIPAVVALNQMDRARKLGVQIDVKRLEEVLGVPVVATVAIRGEGIRELLERAVEVAGREKPAFRIVYDEHVEEAIGILTSELQASSEKPPLSDRAIAVSLLAENSAITEYCGKGLVELARRLSAKLAEPHGEPAAARIARDRYGHAGVIARQVAREVPVEVPLLERLAPITAKPLVGLPLVVLTLAMVYFFVFNFGSLLERALTSWYEGTVSIGFAALADAAGLAGLPRAVLIDGVSLGIEAALGIVIPYVITFYIALAILEDTGILARLAFITDGVMHKIGLHGRAIIPLLLGCGCNVPAILSTRVLETRKARLIAAALISLAVPCSAQTAVILGLVGRYGGAARMLALYAILIALLLAVGRALRAVLPGEEVGLVMEMPPYRIPHPKVMAMKTYLRTGGFFKIALPLLVVGSIALVVFREAGLFTPLVEGLRPLTEQWLGLPALTAIPIVYGILRKEMAIEMLVVLLGTPVLSAALTTHQMFVFALTTALYMPCVATCAALWREFGVRDTVAIAIMTIGIAMLVGGIANHALLAFGL